MAPSHTGLLLVAVGLPGFEFTVTNNEALDVVVHPGVLAMAVYVPLFCADVFRITGFCDNDAKPCGPLHWKLAPAMALLAVRATESCEHTGELLLSCKEPGGRLTRMRTESVSPGHPAMDAVT